MAKIISEANQLLESPEEEVRAILKKSQEDAIKFAKKSMDAIYKAKEALRKAKKEETARKLDKVSLAFSNAANMCDIEI